MLSTFILILCAITNNPNALLMGVPEGMPRAQWQPNQRIIFYHTIRTTTQILLNNRWQQRANQS